jgi:hypothetical protein
MSTYKCPVQLHREVAAAENRLAQLRENNFAEDGTLMISVLQTIGRLRAEISTRQPALLAA